MGTETNTFQIRTNTRICDFDSEIRNKYAQIRTNTLKIEYNPKKDRKLHLTRTLPELVIVGKAID